MFDFIEENVKNIKEPNDVNIIKPRRVENGKKALFARINNGEAIQLTYPVGKLRFPFEPIAVLTRFYTGLFYWSNFAVVNNRIAINKTHLTRLCYTALDKKRVSTYAFFDDGLLIEVCNTDKKYFFKEFKENLEKACEIKFEYISNETIKDSLQKDSALVK